MRLGKVVLKLRAADTSFKNFVAGSAELSLATRYTLRQEMAFVIPLLEDVRENKVENGIHQELVERFGVVVALKNDTSQSEKLGFDSYDRTYNIRNEIFRAILGWQTKETESQIEYRGGRIVAITSNYLWYQFEFEHITLLGTVVNPPDSPERDNAVQEYTVLENDNSSSLVGEASWSGEPVDFETLYVNLILAPSADLPHKTGLPLDDGYPNVTLPDQAQWIDFTVNPDAGAFGDGFSSGFDVDKT